MRAWQIGDVIEGRWEVFGAARGGMGQVYFVKDREWGDAQLAVKSLLLRQDRPPSNRAKALFLRESQVWLDLGAHPNIVSGFYTLEVDGALRFFMEYVPGEPLSSFLAVKQPLPKALDLAVQLSVGMDFIHSRGVVHRDLKPQNCIVSERGDLRVTDFGLGKQIETTDSASQEKDASPINLSAAGLGTPLYMAPEQWKGLSNAGKPADVYAFGVVLYELLGGLHPFGKDTESWRKYSGRLPELLVSLLDSPTPPTLAVLQMFHEEVKPFSLLELGVQAPAPVVSLASRCLEKEPSFRPTFSEIKQELLFLYNRVLGVRYPRSFPPNLEPLSSGENNRAVSYYVMGNARQAKDILGRQLMRDPGDLYPWLNQKLVEVSCGDTSPTKAALEADRFFRVMHPNARQDRQVEQAWQRLSPYLLRHDAKVTASALSGDQTIIATSTADGTIHIWDAKTGERLRYFSSGRGLVIDLGLSFDGKTLVCVQTQVSLFNTETGERLRTLPEHLNKVSAASLSPDGAFVATSCHDRLGRVFDAKTGALLCTLSGHDGRLRTIHFSPDGTTLCTGSYDTTAKLWKISRGFLGWRAKLLHTLKGFEGAVSAVAFSGDGQRVICGAFDGLARVFSVKDGKALQSRKSEVEVLCVALSFDGQEALIGCYDGEFCSFGLDKEDPPVIYTGHKKPILRVDFGITTKDFFSVSEEGVARWSLAAPLPTGPLLIQRGQSAPIQLAQTQEREKLLQQLSSGDRSAFGRLNQLRLRSSELQRDPEILSTLNNFGLRAGKRVGLRDVFVRMNFSGLSQAIFSKDLLLAISNQELRLFRLNPQPSSLRILQGHTSQVTAAAFTPDGTGLITGGQDNSARLWEDFLEGAPERLFPVGSLPHPSWVTAITFVKDGDHFATASQKRVHLWERGSSTPKWASDPCSSWVTALFAPPSGELVIAYCSDGYTRGFSVENGRLLYSLQPPASSQELSSWSEMSRRPHACAPVLSSDGRFLLRPMGTDAMLSDPKTGDVIRWLRGHKGLVKALDLSFDGTRALVGGEEKLVCLYDTASGECLAVIDEHQKEITALTFSPDLRFFATGEQGNVVRLFDAQTASRLYTLDLHGDCTSLSFDTTGRFLLAISEDGSRLWELDAEWGLS